MKDNVIQNKTYVFSLKIIKLYQHLTKQKKEYVISKQILRCGTSIGANVEEAIGAHTTKEFLSKLNIAYKEARETRYWIRLIKDSNYIKSITAQLFLSDCEEICKILAKIIMTTNKKLNWQFSTSLLIYNF